jgi:hypothetical protein
MDMKKILTVIDSKDRKESVSIVTESKTNRLSSAENLAYRHYTTESSVSKPESIISKYFTQVTEELLSEDQNKKDHYAIRAKAIANKVCESIPNLSKHLSQSKKISQSVWSSASQSASKLIGEESDKIDTVTLDIPLLLRLLEYSKEDAKTDMDLHHVTEMLIQLSKENDVLSMDSYEQIVGSQKLLPAPDNVEEGLGDACKVCGQTPCNCTHISEVSNELLGRYKKAASADASKADSQGNFEKGNKRFSGIVKATKKQFANDLKKHK